MKKLYYSIGEVSKITDVETHVLRYWETVFDELTPQKNKGGNRVYKEDDIETTLQLKELIQEKKYSTEGARQVLQQGEVHESEPADLPMNVKKDLKEIRVFLNDLLEKL